MTHEKKRWVTGVAVVALLAAAVVAWAPWRPGASGASGDGVEAAGMASSSASGAAGPLVAPIAAEASASAAAAQGNQASAGNPLDHVILPVFRATPKGDLAMDAQTRVDVERIQALYERDEAQAKLREASGQLPDKAQRELQALYQQYAQYTQAVAQTFPPGLNTESLDDAARQLAGLHELRQQYFGAEQAEAMFGEEEKTSRELLALMRQSKDPKLSLEEKAAQAQEAWKKSHPAQP